MILEITDRKTCSLDRAHAGVIPHFMVFAVMPNQILHKHHRKSDRLANENDSPEDL